MQTILKDILNRLSGFIKRLPWDKIIPVVLIILAFIFLTSCGVRSVHVPVESVKTEYRDNYLRDSVYLYDSVFVKIKEDTVWLEKYRYLYRDKVIKDSVFINDTIRIAYPVVEYKVTNKLKNYQKFLIWTGVISLLALIIFIGAKVNKR